MISLNTHLVRGLAIQVVSVGIWALMVQAALGLGLCPPTILQNQVETMLGCTHTTYFSLYHKVFTRGFNIVQLLTYHLFKRKLILNTLFLTLSAVIPAL